MTSSTPDAEVTPGRPAETLGRARLLVVDDQPTNLQALYQVFASDYQVLAATDGAKALELAATQSPDLILLDVMMPGMDGHEVCHRLKASPVTRDIPVIFLTASSDPDAEADGLDLGAVDFIAKPLNPKVVRARVRTHVTLKRQNDLLRSWSLIDGLTGLYNRRHFDERIQAEWSRACRTGAPLSVLLIDVDFFKRYNDTHGHQAGDECLRHVAQSLQTGLQRPTDLMARYGGEEFVCLLPQTDAYGAQHLAERLRARVEEDQRVEAGSDPGRATTVSVGVGTVRLDAMRGPLDLLREADQNLYRAKAAGRNTVRAGPVSAAG